MNLITQDVAIQLVYLVDGAQQQVDAHFKANRRVANQPDHALVAAGGHIGMVSDLLPYANTVACWIKAKGAQDFPGVFEYEVTESMGHWLADAAESETLTNAAFSAQLETIGNQFFNRP